VDGCKLLEVGAAGSGFVYLKYNKPRGVTCSMARHRRLTL